MLLAFLLMIVVLVGTQYLLKPVPTPKPAAPTATAKKAEELTQKPVPAAIAKASRAGALSSTGALQASAPSEYIIDTNLYHIVFSNKGAVIRSWVLKKFKDSTGKQALDIVNAAADSVPLPFSIDFKDQKSATDPNSALFVQKPTADGLGVDFEFSDGTATFRKTFRFTKDSYLAEVTSAVIQNGAPLPHFLVWRGGFGDQKIRSAAANQHTVHFDLAANKLIKQAPKEAKDGPITASGNYSFAGLEDNFFAAVALPSGSSTIEIRTFSDSVKVEGETDPVPHVGGGISTGAQNQFSFFVGPKDIDILRKLNPKLEQLVDFGWFAFIAKPLFLALNWVYDHWTGNFGWAIILVTVIINILLLPTKLSSLKSARKMQSLQPKIAAINARYKDVSLKDPRKAEQNQEVMAVYKEAGVNPLGGCLPLLVQLPFFYAFYNVLQVAIELRGAKWLWVPDLSQPESLAIHLLPLLLIATQFLMQKMTPAAGVDPNQQKMMMFMPLMFGFMFYYASAGLVLYWLTGNVVGIAQQFLINRLMPAPAPVPVAQTQAKAPVKRVTKKK